jgi:uncharacterized lipoprotein
MKNDKVALLILIPALALALAGCSSTRAKYHVFHDNSKHYRRAQTTQPLSIPSGYSSSKFQEYYVVPNPQTAANIKPVSLMPPDLNASKIPKNTHWW